jgi:hypothetical protein
MTTDGNTVSDGWYVDDVQVSYEPFECVFPTTPPGVPVLISPPDGTTGVPQNVTLTWQAGAGLAPDGYDLEVDGQVVTTTQQTSWPGLLDVGLHTWRVRAYNLVGYTDYSAAWSLFVGYRTYLPLVARNP